MEDGEVCLVASAIFGLVQKSEKEKSYCTTRSQTTAVRRCSAAHVTAFLMYTA